MKTPTWLTRFLTPEPALDDPGARRMVIGVLSIALAVDVFMIAIDVNLWAMIDFGALLLIALILAWRGQLTPGRLLVPLAALLMFGYLMFRNFGLRDTAVLGLPMVLLSASLMNGRKGTAIYGALSLVLLAGLWLAESNGLIENPMSRYNHPTDYLTAGVSIVLITALQWLIIGRLNDNIHRGRQNEAAQRQANEALSTSEARQRALLSAIPELVFRLRRDGVFLDYHAPQVGRLAAPPEVFLGQPVDVVMPPDVAALARFHIEQVLTTGQPAQFEYALTLGDQVHYFDARMTVSGPAEVLTTVRDISDRKQAEDDLKRYAAQAQEQAAQLIMLNEVGRAVSTLRDLNGVLDVIYQQAQRSLPLDVFMIALRDAATNTIDFPLLYDNGQRWQEPPAPLDVNSLIGDVIAHGEPCLLNRSLAELTHTTPRHPLLGDTAKRSASLLYAPLRAGEQIIGVMSAQSYTLNAYDQSDLDLLVGIAHQAAIAIDNARLYSAVQQELIERQRAEQALRDSEALYQSLVEVMPMSVCRKDLAGRFIFVNQRYCSEFNLTPEEIIGKTDFDLHPRELAEKYQQDDRAVMTGGRTIEQVEEHEPIGGRRVYVQVFKSPVYNARSEVTGVQTVFWDVTEHKLAAERLYASEERYRLISTVISDYTFSTAVQPDGRLRLSWVAGAFESITGYTFAEYVARGGWAAALHPDDIERDAAALTTLQMNQPVVSEVRTLTGDGSVRWVRVYAHPVWNYARNVLSGIYGAVQDISERKQAETERENLIRELEGRNAELERFTYTVSHDLKSPLITIRGFLGFLQKDAQAGNTERLAADIKRIGDAADKMQRLLNELLELSRVGRLMNPSVEVPFEEIVSEALALVQGRLLTRPTTVRLVSPLPTVHGDRVRLVEVMQNLVDNAVKFAQSQTELLIEIGVRTDSDSQPIFFVRDNGIGIEPQYHERVFGLFNKLNAQSEGTGVGLALVKRIIEVHGGRIWVESAGVGHGSTFCFTLAARAAANNRGQ